MPRNLIIIGAGSFGREVAWLISDINKAGADWNILGFLDGKADMHGKEVGGLPVLGDIEWLRSHTEAVEVVCAIADPPARKMLTSLLAELPNVTVAPPLIHPNVVISESAEIGAGTIICAGCVVSVDVILGEHCIVDHLTSLGHDVVLENCTTIYPGCNMSGYVKLEECSSVGTGSQIIPKCTVGQGTIVGAGSVVIKDLPAHCTAVGVPAKPIKFHNEGP